MREFLAAMSDLCKKELDLSWDAYDANVAWWHGHLVALDFADPDHDPKPLLYPLTWNVTPLPALPMPDLDYGQGHTVEHDPFSILEEEADLLENALLTIVGLLEGGPAYLEQAKACARQALTQLNLSREQEQQALGEDNE
jgi:hypothetical protein